MDRYEQNMKNQLDEFDNEYSNKDLGLGFIIGTVFISIMIFLIFILKEVYKIKYQNFFIIVLPIILFLIMMIFITGSFKIKRKKIGYGIIIAIFGIPVVFFIIYFLSFLIKIS
jgi:hypothetical protein